MGQMDGKVAIVTGGGSGIGKGIALAFAQAGCSVVIAGRNAQRLAEAADELRRTGAEILDCPADVTVEADVQALFAKTMERFGRLDVLVNSSGAFDGGPIEDLSLEAWNKVMGANVTGPFLCTREAFRIFKPAGGGRIINIGSISAQMPRQNSAPYTTSKHAITGLTRSAALEGRAYGISVGALHPGNTAVERRTQSSKEMDAEPMIETEQMARAALLMATLPPEANMLEAILMPIEQLYVGRG